MSKPSDPRKAPGNALTVTDTPETSLDAHGHDPADYDWVPVLRKRRADGWTPQRQRAFIGALADSGSVFTAAQQVGMSASTAYRLRRSPEGAAFAAAWDAAIQQAAYALVDAAFERAIHGSEEPVYDRDGRRIGRRFRQSDAMMMFLMRKHFPDRYGDLGRDRPEIVAPPANVPVAQTLIPLGPVQPADPLALFDQDALAEAFDIADRLDGELQPEHRQDGPEEYDDAPVLGADFEEKLEAAKRAADPEGYAAAEERRAEYEEQEAEDRERHLQRRRRR